MVWGCAALVADVGLARLGYGIFLPSICSDFGGACVFAGALSATHLAGYLAGTLAGAPLVRRFGTRRTAVASQTAVAAALALSALMPSLSALAAVRVASGFAAGVVLVAIMP
ncbi:MAG: MFS transporter, partial [Candidatus Velthaea sp.]